MGRSAPVALGHAALDGAARDRGAAGFAEFDAAERPGLVAEIASEHPALVPALILHTYAAYYQHPRVVEALGIETWPPHPKGYELEAGDLELLDAVRARRKLYRDA